MAADPDSLFCKIVAGEIPATRVAEDDRTITFMDINPATRGHVLVVPREHAKDLLAIDAEDLAAVAQAGRRIAAAMPERLGADGVNLINSCGRAAWADRLPLPPARDPALRRRPAAAPVDARAGRPRRDRRGRTRAGGLIVRRLALTPAVVAAAAALAPAPAAAQVEAIEPTFQLDRRGDVRGPLDVVRVAMSTRTDGSLRAELTMRRGWDAADLGAGGSVCVKLYVRAEPDAQAPEYLVCATAPATGAALGGEVLRNRANGLPRTVAEAVVSRPSARTVHLGFEPAAIRRPATLRFAGESVWRGRRCPPTTGCVDLAPDAPGARDFRLRRNASSG